MSDTKSTVISVELTHRDESGNTSSEVVDIDLDLNALTLRESVALEEAIGTEAFDRLMEKGEFAMRPSTIQAVLYAKIKGKYPEVGLNDFDFDLSALSGGEGDTPNE